MGLFSKIFNWVFDRILSPVFSFISKLLETVLSWLFENVLAPLLINVLWPLFEALVELILEIFAEILYSLFVSLLQIVDSMQAVFDIFAGLENVTYNGKSYSLLELMFRLDTVQTVVMVVAAIALVLTLMFAILGVARSAMDLDGEQSRPVSKVLSATFKAVFKMFLIPIVCLFAITMSCQILIGINTALKGSDTTLSRMVFVVASLDASKEAKYNISGKLKDEDTPVKTVENIGIGDEIRKDYYSGKKSYTDKEVVKQSFNLARFDYLVGFLGSIFLVVVLAICLISFICRIFEVLLLFIVSPFFASPMPLDDGEKFKGWQDLFVAKLFGGYGTVVAMQLYMLLCPAVMGGKISFGEGTTEANYLIRLIFLLGGAWATVKCGPMITQLLNYQAGSSETALSAQVTGGMMTAASVTASAVKSVGKGVQGLYKGHGSKRDMAMAASDERIASRLNKGVGAKPGGAATGSPAGSSSASQQPGGSGTRSSDRPQIGAHRSDDAGGENHSATSPGGRDLSNPENLRAAMGEIAAGAHRDQVAGKKSEGPRRVGAFFGGKLTLNTSKGGHRYLGLNFGKIASFGRDEKGRFNCQFLGIGFRKGADGKMDKVSLPFVRLKTDSGGKYKVSKVKAPMVNFKRAETVTTGADGKQTRTFGDMYCSDLSAIGLHRRFDSQTGNVERQSLLGVHYAKNSDGEYVKTHQNVLGRRYEFEKAEDGFYRMTNKTGYFMDTSYSYDADGKRHTESVIGHGGYHMEKTYSFDGEGKIVKDKKLSVRHSGKTIYKRSSNSSSDKEDET